MSVRAGSMSSGPPMAAARAEHISLESEPDPIATPATHRRRKVHSSYVLSSPLRGCETEIALLEDHYAAVRTVRPDAAARKYEIDLRFANPKPVCVRSISWFWLALAACLALLGAGGLWSASAGATVRWLHPVFLTALLTLLAAVGALLMFLRRTVESLEFTSMHGGATLISVTGGIGSARTGKQFFIELIKSINAAKAARPQPKHQLLRDEMREHHRLRELGVLNEKQYELSKQRILAEH